jgi:hypothetical protein
MRWLAFALATALASPSLASQYSLDQARQIISRAEAKSLRRAGIQSTFDILIHGRTPSDRAELSTATGLSVEKILSLVMLADLMRVRGIGPDVARLLTAVKVRTVEDLQRADPEATAVAVHDINKRLHLSTNPPGAESISYWVVQARELPVVLE